MRRSDRLGAILEDLSSGGSVGVSDLVERFGVSAPTVRRDLELLESQKLLTRTHGGAIAQGLVYELPLRYKSARHHDEKRRIAAAASELVRDGTAIGLTGGTTTTEVSRALADRPGLTVVTNALNIAGELAIRPNLKLVVTGGLARAESYELVGPLAEQSLAGLNLDIVFLGVDGISVAEGLTTHHEVEAHTNLALIEHARRTVVVADSSKLGRVAFARICPLERVDGLITDAGASESLIAEFAGAGLEITTV